MRDIRIEDVANKTFDYVVVGAGTAGLTLAARLSEDHAVSVAVLEAGPAHLNDPNILVPAQFGKTFFNPHYDWAFSTAMQRHCNDRSLHWTRGKGLGGSSTINFLVWTKPCAQDINTLEKLGNKGWTWESFAEYSRKSEAFHEPTQEQLTAFPETFDMTNRGKEGPVQICIPHHAHIIDKLFQETQNYLGLPTIPDAYGGNINGAWVCSNTQDPRTHTRSNAMTAYYLPNEDRPNLTVLTNALAIRVLFDEHNDPSHGKELTATGVEFQFGEEGGNTSSHIVHARNEVILSAGTIKSPQILELSGVGRKEVLEQLGVNVKLDLRGVGENLQEHLFTGLTFELNDKVKHQTLDWLQDPDYAAEQMKLHSSQQGLYRSGITAFAYFPLSHANPRDAPGLIDQVAREIEKQKTTRALAPGLEEQFELQLQALKDDAVPDLQLIAFPAAYSSTFTSKPGKEYVTMCIVLNHPFSRGTIHAVSPDPSKDPEIDPHFFENDFDLENLVQNFKYVRSMAKTELWTSAVSREVEPGLACSTDDEIREYIKKTVSPTWHAVGTCSMLPREKNGVVDSELKVHGTKNLRVVDISIIPLHIASHTQATAYFVGEKAADIIRSGVRVVASRK